MHVIKISETTYSGVRRLGGGVVGCRSILSLKFQINLQCRGERQRKKREFVGTVVVVTGEVGGGGGEEAVVVDLTGR
jgi:hypothetical protein